MATVPRRGWAVWQVTKWLKLWLLGSVTAVAVDATIATLVAKYALQATNLPLAAASVFGIIWVGAIALWLRTLAGKVAWYYIWGRSHVKSDLERRLAVGQLPPNANNYDADVYLLDVIENKELATEPRVVAASIITEWNTVKQLSAISGLMHYSALETAIQTHTNHMLRINRANIL